VQHYYPIEPALISAARNISFVLSRAHSTPVSDRESACFTHMERKLTQTAVSSVLKAAGEPIQNVVESVSKLSQSASKVPYYKFNSMWTRSMQDVVSLALTFSLYFD
jgi:hypothetical protein